MKRTDRIGKNVYIDFSMASFETLDKVDKFLEKYKIKIYWLLEDGVIFDYPDNIIVKNYPGDISFFDSATNNLILTYIENFGCVEFLIDDEVVLSVPILDLDLL